MRVVLPFQKMLSKALKEGGEFADLFFEQTYSFVVICEEDRTIGWGMILDLVSALVERMVKAFQFPEPSPP